MTLSDPLIENAVGCLSLLILFIHIIYLIYLIVRSEGDRHRSLTGAHQRPETRLGPHQGTINLSVCVCVFALFDYF